MTNQSTELSLAKSAYIEYILPGVAAVANGATVLLIAFLAYGLMEAYVAKPLYVGVLVIVAIFSGSMIGKCLHQNAGNLFKARLDKIAFAVFPREAKRLIYRDICATAASIAFSHSLVLVISSFALVKKADGLITAFILLGILMVPQHFVRLLVHRQFERRIQNYAMKANEGDFNLPSGELP